jgi:ribosomal protein L31
MSANSTISKRSMARLEAFVDGVSAAIPRDPYKSAVVAPSSSAASLMVDVKSKIFPFWNNSHSSQRRGNSSSIRRYANRYPQIAADNLILRIELYIRSVQRIYGGNTTKNHKTSMTELTKTQQQTSVEECNVHQEPTKLLLRSRVDCICRAFIANVSCVTLVQPVLLRLLGSTTRELLAVQTLSEDLWKAIKREFLA